MDGNPNTVWSTNPFSKFDFDADLCQTGKLRTAYALKYNVDEINAPLRETSARITVTFKIAIVNGTTVISPRSSTSVNSENMDVFLFPFKLRYL